MKNIKCIIHFVLVFISFTLLIDCSKTIDDNNAQNITFESKDYSIPNQIKIELKIDLENIGNTQIFLPVKQFRVEDVPDYSYSWEFSELGIHSIDEFYTKYLKKQPDGYNLFRVMFELIVYENLNTKELLLHKELTKKVINDYEEVFEEDHYISKLKEEAVIVAVVNDLDLDEFKKMIEGVAKGEPYTPIVRDAKVASQNGACLFPYDEQANKDSSHEDEAGLDNQVAEEDQSDSIKKTEHSKKKKCTIQ